MNSNWIIGRRGLLGSALAQAMTQRACSSFVSAQPWAWADAPSGGLPAMDDKSNATPASVLGMQIREDIANFARTVTSTAPWRIFWAAGIGTMNCTPQDMHAETWALSALLTALNEHPVFSSAPGSIVFASSAGAIYAGAHHSVLCESSPPAPTTAYAQAKLQQEAMLTSWAQQTPGRQVALARISTLYGAGQGTGKQQGLISYMARHLLRNKPMNIFVPLETQRDYLYVNDAARALLSLPEHDLRTPVQMRVLAAERPTSIAEILGIFRRLARRSPRVVTSAAPASHLYKAQITFRSDHRSWRDQLHCTPLHIGIARVLESERLAYAKPQAARPPGLF